MPEQRQTFRVPLNCPNCRNKGVAVWEEADARDRARGPERKLISLEGAFHSETGRTMSGDPVVVCTACDEIQDD